MSELRRDWLDRAMSEAAGSYRVAPDPPLDEMWAEIERAHFDTRARPGLRRRLSAWLVPAMGIAAALVLGVGIGRYLMPARASNQIRLAAADSTPVGWPRMIVSPDAGADIATLARGPYEDVTTAYFGETVALLGAFPGETSDGRANTRFVAQAGELLTTTRLLIDSPAGADPEMRVLLEDLELVLAQIARMRNARGNTELDLIASALDQGDVLPRLRSAAAVYAALNH
ncbi:MAG: hypothetical protein ABR543_17380 [Gemmatimonadaceae bacterium]